MDLLMKMLDPNPVTRISPIEVLDHPFLDISNCKKRTSTTNKINVKVANIEASTN